MTTTLTSTLTSGSEPNIDTTHRQQLPETLRWRPLPTPLVDETSSPHAVLKTPDEPVPCRRCLQDSQVGDEMLLLSYDPFLGDSPYRCASPIFVHSKPVCKPAIFQSPGGALPEQLRKRLLSVRAYDGKHMMHARRSWTEIACWRRASDCWAMEPWRSIAMYTMLCTVALQFGLRSRLCQFKRVVDGQVIWKSAPLLMRCRHQVALSGSRPPP